MAIIADFAWSKPSVSQLDSWGVVAVGMYVSRDPGKDATPEIVRQYASAGIKTFLFFEDQSGNAGKGYAQGQVDATLAKEQSAALGKPPWAPVVAACDFDVPDYAPHSTDPKAKLGPLAEYFQAWCEVMGGPAEVGGYGGYWAVSRLAAAGLISVGVQTVAWSGGLVDTHHIAALQNARTLDNGNVDIEVIESVNLLNRLAWVPGEPEPGAVPVAPPHPTDGNWLCKGQLPLVRLAATSLRATPSAVLEMTAKHNGGQFPAPLAAYVDGGDLTTAHVPAGTVLWFPRSS